MSDKSCVPCPSRLPSCVRLPDGKNPVVGSIWLSKYVICYQNRTMGTSECPKGEYFHPRRRVCLQAVDPGTKKLINFLIITFYARCFLFVVFIRMFTGRHYKMYEAN